MQIEGLDHFVLTVRDPAAAIAFYREVLGFEPVTFAGGRQALLFGRQKINLHPADDPVAPHADRPTPGAADLCFVTDTPIEEVVAHLKASRVPIVEGPVRRTGARGPITSVYFRDPDRNLIEVGCYVGP